MFRDMRRIKQKLSMEDCEKVLNSNTSGVLSVIGDEGYPYGVPLSYVYSDGKLYFHCAKVGHKIDALHSDSKACFTVIDKDQIVPSEFTTYFRSVIAFGKARLLEDEGEMREALKVIASKYSPDESDESVEKSINKSISFVGVIAFDIDHLSGKEAIELVNDKN